MRKFLSLIVVMMLAFNVKAQGLAITEAADFTFSDNGTEKTLFEVLDGGQHALLYFFNCGINDYTSLINLINNVYEDLDKNQNDVYMIGIDQANESILLNQWAFDYEVEYPLVAKNQGANSISQTYGGITGVFTPALVLIAPNHDIILEEIWPIISAEQVVGIINDNLVTDDDNTGDEGDDEGDDNPSTPIELAVPQNLVATATETTIVLTWDAVDGATKYNIYEGTALLDEVTETTYTIENLAEGRYCFKVSALEDMGYESDAAEACATVGEESGEDPEEPGDGGEDPEAPVDPEEPGDNPSDPFNPATPTVVATTTETTITLTWNAVDGATEYNIYTPSSFDSNVLGITETTYTFENLITGVEYCFEVCAVSWTGESDAARVCATVGEEPGDGGEEGEDPEELTPVVEIEVKNVTPLSVEVAFTPAGECASYYILLDTEASMEMWAAAFGVTLEQLIEEWSIERSGPSTNLWNENIVPNTEYTIFVLSKDIEGEVIQLDKKKVTTLSLGGEGVSVIDLQVEVTSNTSVFVTATPNEETAEYHYILIEKAYADSIGPDSTMKIIYEDPYTLYEIDRWEWIDLNANTEFYAIAQGKNAQGEWGEITKVEFVTTVDEDEEEGEDPETPVDPEEPGDGGEEGEDPETPVDPEQPNQPTDSLVLSAPALAVNTVTETTVVLVWNAIDSATSYNVYMDSVLVKNVTDTICTVDSLTAETTYSFTVKALADTLESEFSNAVTVTTLKAEGEEPEQPENPEEPGDDPEEPGDDPEEPGDEPEEPIELDAPENVEAKAISTSSIIITWDKVENALSYNIYRDGELLDDTENTNYTDKDLEYNTEYCYTIEAVNGKETSDKSEEVCVKTLGEGVEELEASYNIYPNPVNDKLYIETQTQTQTVEIYDVYGRRQSMVNGQQSTVIDVSDLNSGVYFVKVVTSEGEAVKRFIKK